MSTLRIGVVGGGILGLAIARELSIRFEEVDVAVFEKEERLASHQTGHNSGVVHAGIYYRPGSLKAELCVRGRRQLQEYCQDRDLPFVECGKLVVAVEESELPRLDDLERSARANGVAGLVRVGAGEIGEIEPYAVGLAALHSPATALTDFSAVADSFASDVRSFGGTIHLGTEVTALRKRGSGCELVAGGRAHGFDRVVVCAGLQADRVGAGLVGPQAPRVVPFRGEYLQVAAPKQEMVRGMVYPVPDPRYPFLGVHFTRKVTGELEVGPNAVLALDREGYRRRDFDRADVAAMLAWPGFWRMARDNWLTGIAEIGGSLSTRSYMRRAARYVPGIDHRDVVSARTGVRAQAVERDGSLVDDFRVYQEGGIACVLNAPSPAATSSIAIAEHVVDGMELPRLLP